MASLPPTTVPAAAAPGGGGGTPPAPGATPTPVLRVVDSSSSEGSSSKGQGQGQGQGQPPQLSDSAKQHLHVHSPSLAALMAPRRRPLVQSSDALLPEKGAAPPVPLQGLTTEIDPSEIMIGEKLGAGASGEVYEGVCRGQQVAVKILFLKDVDETVLASVRSEVAILSKMRHPNIIMYLGASTVNANKICIVTELMAADLKVLIEAPFAEVPFLSRLRVARDAAKGMLWLHRSNPMIIHRDLKPGNLLIDENLRVVVADFGLSDQLKRDSLTFDDGGGYKGTPHYLAPEVLRGVWFNEKIDVYSYALVLWELFTGKRLWRDAGWGAWNMAQLRHKICFEFVRPPLPGDDEPGWSARLRSLLERAWADEPNARPAFDAILQELNEIIIDHAVHDPDGRRLWAGAFLGEDRVGWQALQEVLAKWMGLSRDAPGWEFLHSVLVGPHAENKRASFGGRHSGGHVPLEQFGKLLDWFGPQALQAQGDLLGRVAELLNQRWFHGDLTVHAAETLLCSHDPGSFLVRFSTSTPGGFTISGLDRSGALQHIGVSHPPGAATYSIGETTYASLAAAVAAQTHGPAAPFDRPCPGSPFAAFWPRSPRLTESASRAHWESAAHQHHHPPGQPLHP